MRTRPRFLISLRAWLSLAAISILILGVILWSHSLTLSPYKDFDLYREESEKLEFGDDEAFRKLRAEFLTSKFALQDHGISLAILGLLGILVVQKNSFLLRSPNSFFVLACISVSLPIISIAGFIFDILQSLERGEFPSWADSIGLGLIMVPVLFGLMFVWSLIHLIALGSEHHPRSSFRHAFSLRHCWWPLLLATMNAITAIVFLVDGCYWLATPNLCWLYFYLSLGASYQLEHRITPNFPK